jgi:hypothetical protein
MKITQRKDQLAAIGMKVENKDLASTTMNGFSEPRESFV